MTDLQPGQSFTHLDTDSGGKFYLMFDDGSEAKMTYVTQGHGTVAIDHTFVPPAHRGGDIAPKLVEFGVNWLADNGQKIKPVCSYVVAQFQRNKDWQQFEV